MLNLRAMARGVGGNGKASQKVVTPRIRWSHWVFLLVGFLAAWTLFEFGLHRRKAPATKSAATSPWGRLVITPITLEWPANWIPANVRIEKEVRWVFAGKSKQEVEGILDRSGLDPEQRRTLSTSSAWVEASGGWEVYPPNKLVEGLTDGQREALHRVLVPNQRNVGDQFPFRIEVGEFESWLKESGLSESKQDLIRRIAVSDGDYVSIYDLPLLFVGASPDETRLLLQALGRVATYLVKLRVEPGEETGTLIDYWSHGGRGRELEPLLDSMSRTPTGAEINISFFLPSFARERLYVYPPPAAPDAPVRVEDCFWTAMNFFNEEPDDELLNTNVVRQRFLNDYFKIEDAWHLGDLVALYDKNANVFHVCNYIADDIVLTKNGRTANAPCVLMKIADLKRSYAAYDPIQILVMRRKPR